MAGSRTCRRAGGALFFVLGVGCVIPISPPTGAPDSTPSGLSPLAGSWVNTTGNLAGMDSECGNLSDLSAKPDEDLLIAGIALKGLWASRDGGGTWQALGTGAGSAMISNRTSSIVYDPKNPMRYWESGIYGNAGGVYETMDDGTTFAQIGNMSRSDLVSVDLSDPGRMTLLAGAHEESQKLYLWTDASMMWTNIGGNLPPNTNCTFPLVIDAHTYLVGCGGYGGGVSGVYRTVDAGATWAPVTSSGGGSAPLVASDGSIYWASPNGGMTRSTDNGQHWTDVTGPGVLTRLRPTELPDGRIAALGTRFVLVSADHGATWKPGSANLPYGDAVGITYSAQRKAFYVWHFTCGNGPIAVPPDAVMRFDFDYLKN